MKVIFGRKNDGISAGESACALGFFDGVHAGHQNLISVLKQVSDLYNLDSMVFTFDKHPMSLLNRDRAPKLITDNETKSAIFDELEVDTVYYRHVDEDFLNTDPKLFLNDILYKQLNVRAIVAGFNFRFGCKGGGDSSLLMEFGREKGIDVRIVNPFYIKDILVSSTVIRNYISDGNIKMANMLLKREYSMHGKVVHGMQRGRVMGFPTANISVGNEMLIPKNGVYITKAFVNGIARAGITNVGYNPTFGNGSITIETHIMDFDEDIYDSEIILKFYDRIRDERKFSGMAELTAQINSDRQSAITFFGS